MEAHTHMLHVSGLQQALTVWNPIPICCISVRSAVGPGVMEPHPHILHVCKVCSRP